MKGIRAAFVKIAGGRTVFLPLEDAVGCVYTRKEGKREELCGGDEILLQIVRDPVGTKDAVASCNLPRRKIRDADHGKEIPRHFQKTFQEGTPALERFSGFL